MLRGRSQPPESYKPFVAKVRYGAREECIRARVTEQYVMVFVFSYAMLMLSNYSVRAQLAEVKSVSSYLR